METLVGTQAGIQCPVCLLKKFLKLKFKSDCRLKWFPIPDIFSLQQVNIHIDRQSNSIVNFIECLLGWRLQRFWKNFDRSAVCRHLLTFTIIYVKIFFSRQIQIFLQQELFSFNQLISKAHESGYFWNSILFTRIGLSSVHTKPMNLLIETALFWNCSTERFWAPFRFVWKCCKNCNLICRTDWLIWFNCRLSFKFTSSEVLIGVEINTSLKGNHS